MKKKLLKLLSGVMAAAMVAGSLFTPSMKAKAADCEDCEQVVEATVYTEDDYIDADPEAKHPYIKGQCQIPYAMVAPGEDGYLIGFQTYESNPNWTYQMLILDCTTMAWVYATDMCHVPEDCFWTVWQPEYGFFWTLFSLRDENGKEIDRVCYGFKNEVEKTKPTPKPEENPTPAPDPAPVPEPTPEPETTPDPAPEAVPTPIPDSESSAKPDPTPEPEPTPAPEPAPEPTNIKVGEHIYFGTYKDKPIEWQVMDVQNGEATLFSVEILEREPYNGKKDESLTWETCFLRRWLNNGFYNTAFTAEEKAKIKTTTVMNDDNPLYGTPGGNTTNDRVYLFSLADIEHYFQITPEKYEKVRRGEITWKEYNDEKLIARCSDGWEDEWWWWLRSPGSSSNIAACVGDIEYGGTVLFSGNSVIDGGGGVRPVIKISL